jgi:hypothetical protein
MREVRAYDRDFPTREQILAGDPGAGFPKEVWLEQVQPGEFAVRYKDFKTGLARNPDGEHVQSSEICRIFSNLEEARADSRKVANEHWVVRCFIFDHTGARVGTISNNKEVSKLAAVMYARILLWIGFYTLAGMGVLWMVYKMSVLFLGPSLPVLQPRLMVGWLDWMNYAFAGLIVGMLVWYLRVRFIAKRTVSRMQRKLESAISPQEKKRFAELNAFYGSRDPAERERFLKLANEYQEKIREALKK